jgi:peptide/nickel transport system ATP-binding protein
MRQPDLRPAVPAGATDRAAPLLAVRNLSVTFATEDGPLRAVRGLSYEVSPGEILAIVGESGSGKSVSSLAVMGLLPSNAKVVADGLMFEGRNLLTLSKAQMRALRGRDIGMIFQDPMTALNPVISVGDQLTEPLKLHLGLSERQARERAKELLALVGIPDVQARLDQYPHQFSGGMRQRVMIAIGLACNPRLLIADEPTTALDVTIQAQILELMQDLCRRLGVALVVITHNLGIVSRYADRVLVMYGGRVQECGDTAAVLGQPRHLYPAGLLSSVPSLEGALNRRLAAIDGTPPNPRLLPPGCPFAPRCHQAQRACQEEPRLQATDVGSLSACVRAGEMAAGRVRWQPGVPAVPIDAAPARTTDTAALVQVESLEKTFTVRSGLLGRRTEVKAVRDVTLSIGRQETVGVVGESGCGKSTLGRLLLRLDEPTAGRILFRGEDITHLGDNALRSFRRQAQVVFQDPFSSLNPRQRIADIVAEPMRVHGIVAGRDEARAEAARLMQLVGLRDDHAERFAHQLSGGQRQRVAIARALAMRPEFIVCDEAVSALDVSIQAQVVNLLSDLQERLHLSYLFIGHDLAVVRQIATRVVVMYLGRIVEIAERDAFYSRPQHPYSQVLMAAVPDVGEVAGAERAVIPIRGEPPSPLAPPSGCAFRTRCPVVMPECARTVPELRETAPGQQVACLRFQ